MLAPTIVPYLVIAIALCLGLLSIIAIFNIAKSVDELARVGERPRLKIPADCPKTDYDFIVDLECPDGTAVRVEIPIDPNSYEGKCSRVCGEYPQPVGLNLICPGHYT